MLRGDPAVHDRTAIVADLLLALPTCLDCLVNRTGLIRADVQLALVRIAKVVEAYRESGRCLGCAGR